jgi:hypothetical protein
VEEKPVAEIFKHQKQPRIGLNGWFGALSTVFDGRGVHNFSSFVLSVAQKIANFDSRNQQN